MRSPAFVLLLCACATTRSASEAYELAHRDLWDAMQYGDYQVVSQYLRPDLRADFLARSYGLGEKLKVLEYTPVTSAPLDRDGKRMRSVTRLSWYELPSTTVKTENVIIDWTRERTPGRSVWLIEEIRGGPLEVAPASPAAQESAPHSP